jgi:trans-aconitate 2-methyltransferase
VKLTSRVMEWTPAYRLWQAPVVERKFAPILAHNDLSEVRRVLDVGCGPGTNTAQFEDADYLGLDINPAYIESARRRHGRDFIAADVTEYRIPPEERFDFVLLNSFIHHIDDDDARKLLSHLATLLTDDGHVHIIDLVLPDERGFVRWLALQDRGEYPRPVEAWRTLFSEAFEPAVFEVFPVGVPGLKMHDMVYFKGKARR